MKWRCCGGRRSSNTVGLADFRVQYTQFNAPLEVPFEWCSFFCVSATTDLRYSKSERIVMLLPGEFFKENDEMENQNKSFLSEEQGADSAD